MRLIGFALIALLTATPAHAGIETLVISVASLLSAIGVSSVLAAIGITPLAATLGLLAIGGAVLSSVLGSKSLTGSTASSSIDPGSAKETFENSESPELRAVGRVRLGGLKAFGNTAGFDRYRLILHCKGENDGFESFFLGGREVIADVENGGAVTSYPWEKPDGTQFAFIQVKNGDGTETAWSDLLTAFSDLWTSDHRVQGIVQSLLRFVSPGLTDEYFLKLYQSGVPDLESVVRAEKDVYDPRTEVSAWTQNGVLNAMHVLLSYPEFTLADFDLDFIADEADRADALIATLGDDVVRSRCCGVWSSETARGDNMAKVLESIGAWIVPRSDGAKIGIQLIDDDQVAEVTIAARHIVSIDWQSGPQGVERPNICRLKYYSPERNYEMGEIDLTGIAWARIDDEVTAYGDKYLDVELLFCPNASQAQRRARQMFLLARSDSGIIRTNMAGLAVWGCRMVSFEFPDDLGPILCMIGAPRVLDDQGLVEIPFVVWPTFSAWVPATDEALAPEQIPEVAYGTPITTPAIPTAATVVTYPGAGGTVTRFSYLIPVDATLVEACYRVYNVADLPSVWKEMTEYVAPNGFAHAYAAADESGNTLDGRLRTFDGDENGSTWSPTLNVIPVVDNSAPSVPVLALDADPPILTFLAEAPNSLNVSYLSFNGPSTPVDTAVKPGQQVIWTQIVAGNYPVEVIAHATDGTASGTASGESALDTGSGGGAILSGFYYTGSGSITLKWRASNDLSVATMKFTGASAPADTPAIANDTGTWTASGLGAGLHSFSARSFDGATNPIGSVASISITI